MEKDDDDYFDKRIIVITGDITNAKFTLSESELQYLAQNITTIIDSAALVKHFGSYQHFYDINVNGTNNIINFAHKYNKKLYYISTLSVSGNSFDETKEIQKFDETNFYIGQDFSNVYIHTKFEAEKLILEKIQTGLDACILRIGNITNRYSDGVFQINVSENAFVPSSLIAAGVTSWLQSKIMMMTNPQNSDPGNPAAAMTKSMLYTMPIMMGVLQSICRPGWSGWMISNLFGILQQVILSKHYKKKFAEEAAQ